jgi:tetratricopeptide (TPR) repeat protein
MTPSRNRIRALLLLLAWLTFGPGAWGYTHAQLGTVVEDAEMPTLAGGTDHLLTDATANVFIFFRPGQDYSRLALKELAAVEKELAGKSVHWVGIVSDRAAVADVQSLVKEAGLSMPVLIDVGDVLYGKIGVAQVPVTLLFDQQHKLVAYQSFTKVNYAAVVRARVRNLLKEISDEELASVLNPPAALTDSDEAAALRRLKLASMLFQAKNYDKALENVGVSIQENPSAAAYALRGDILSAQDKCSEAISDFGQALKLDPQNARAIQGMKTCQQKKP